MSIWRNYINDSVAECRIQVLPGPRKRLAYYFQAIRTSATTWCSRFRLPQHDNTWQYITDQQGQISQFSSREAAIEAAKKAHQHATGS